MDTKPKISTRYKDFQCNQEFLFGIWKTK